MQIQSMSAISKYCPCAWRTRSRFLLASGSFAVPVRPPAATSLCLIRGYTLIKEAVPGILLDAAHMLTLSFLFGRVLASSPLRTTKARFKRTHTAAGQRSLGNYFTCTSQLWDHFRQRPILACTGACLWLHCTTDADCSGLQWFFVNRGLNFFSIAGHHKRQDVVVALLQMFAVLCRSKGQHGS